MTRVALVDHPAAASLAAALPDASVVRAPGVPLIDAVLGKRGFTGPLSHLPLLVARLRAFDVVHAFTAPDAAAGLRAGKPVVFTCVEVLGRDTVSDRRLRLRLLTDAVERSDVVVAASPEARDALRRWMAVDADIVPLSDFAAYAELYRRVGR